MPAAVRPDEELMNAYLDGDAGAFRELFERYTPRLRRWLRRWVYSEELIEDLVQQTFLQVHRARRDFRSGAPFRPWVFTIAHNLAREQGRRRLRKPEVLSAKSGAPEVSVAAAGQARVEAAHDLDWALAQLPPAQREIVLLHWAEGLSHQEIAQVVGANPVTVRVRAHRAYAALREILQTRNGGPGSGIPTEE